MGTQMAEQVLKFAYEENGFCRVYYKGPHGSLYCWQNDGPFKFYRCSKDGEPSYEVTAVEGQKATTVKPPPGNSQTEKELTEFLKGFQNAEA